MSNISAIRAGRWFVGALVSLLIGGCTSVPPTNVATDRMDYGQVVADSWKRQTLLNVVRLRYADAPVFLDVASIINSYTIGGNANAQATMPSRTNPDVLQLGATGNWSNTPTVTYQPLLGDRFTKSLLQPIPPSSVFQLLQGGWGANLVFPTVVGSVNGLRNTSLGAAAGSSGTFQSASTTRSTSEMWRDSSRPPRQTGSSGLTSRITVLALSQIALLNEFERLKLK